MSGNLLLRYCFNPVCCISFIESLVYYLFYTEIYLLLSVTLLLSVLQDMAFIVRYHLFFFTASG